MDYSRITQDLPSTTTLDLSKVYFLAHDTEEPVAPETPEIKPGRQTPDEAIEIPPEEIAAAQARMNQIFPENHPKYAGIASARGYDQSTARLTRVHYSHDAMIDLIISDPTIKQKEIAERFGHTQAWVSRIIGSDAFQAALAKRREELTDPFLVATIEERMTGLAYQSLDILAQKLEETQKADLAMEALKVTSKALGFGARNGGSTNVQNNFVVALPGKVDNPDDWADKHRRTIEG